MQLRLPLRGLISLALFAALCAIVSSWALVLFSPRAPVAPTPLAAPGAGPIDTARSASLFSAATSTPTAPVASAPVNLRIVGVMAAEPRRAGREANLGVALISIDGQPARPFALGQSLPNGMRVQAIRRDSVEFLDQGRTLSAPTPAAADLGLLTRGRTGTATGPTGAPPGDVRTGSSAAVPPAPLPAPLPAPPPAPAANAEPEPSQPPGNPGSEAPMPPPPPIPATGAVPGPVILPGSR